MEVLVKRVVLVVSLGFMLGQCAKHSEQSGSEPVAASRQALVVAAVTPHHPILNFQGRVQAIDADPADADYAIVATDHGGAFRTTNGGVSWERLDNLFPNATHDVVICPTERNLVFLTAPQGTGTSVDSDPGGVFRSGDGGDTWQRLNIPGANVPHSGYGIGFQPGTNCEKVFVGTSFGLTECSDFGLACENIGIPDENNTIQFQSAGAVHVRSNGIVDMHTGDGYRRFQRDTAGLPTWSPVQDPIGKDCCEGQLPLAFGPMTHSITSSPFSEDVLFAVTLKLKRAVPGDPTSPFESAGTWEVYESDNGGNTWTSLQMPPQGNGRPPHVATVPARNMVLNQFDLYVGPAVWLFRQTCTDTGVDGSQRCTIGDGTSGPSQPFETIVLRPAGVDPPMDPTACGNTTAPCSHDDPSDISFHPTTHCPLFLATDGGVLKVRDGAPATTCGQTGDWATIGSETLNALEITNLTGQVHPNSGLRTDLYFSTWDNFFWASLDAGTTWPRNIFGEGGGLQIAHSSPNRDNSLITLQGPTFQANPGFVGPLPHSTGWQWNDTRTAEGRVRPRGNSKERVTFSCPDGDQNDACDTCVDANAPMGECDVGAGGVPCQDALGLPLLFDPANEPPPVCLGTPCIDEANVFGKGADGLCDPINGFPFLSHAPIALPDGRWLQWDRGALRYDRTTTPPTRVVMQPSQLWLSNVGGTAWTPVPNAAMSTVGVAEGQSNYHVSTGMVSRESDGSLAFYQPVSIFEAASGSRRNGLIRVERVTDSTAAAVPADNGLASIEERNLDSKGLLPMIFGVDPADSRFLLARTVSGFMKSSDRGQSWVTDRGTAQLDQLANAGGRLQTAVLTIGFDSVSSGRILVGTEEGGILGTLDRGQTWARLCRSDRVPLVNTFFFDEVEQQIYASSYGRGLWKVDPTQQQVPAFTVPPQNVTANDCGPVNIGQAQASDQCEAQPASISVTVTAGLGAGPNDPEFGCETGVRPCGNFQRGSSTVVWTATDQYGDAATTTRTVTVNDTTPPVFANAGNVTLATCNPAGEAITLPVPTATDRCIGNVTVTGVVIASTSATVPLPVVGGGVTLPTGTHTIRWTASDGINTATVDQVVTVRPGIFANRQLELRDNAQTTFTNGNAAPLANRGSFLTALGVQARSGAIQSVARVDLRNRASVLGALTTQAGLTRGNQTTVTGPIRTFTTVTLPPFPSLAQVVFPPPTGGDQFANPGLPVTLAPGSYGNVFLNSGGTLVLSTGDYFFVGLTLNSSSTMRIDDALGPVRLFVSSSFAYRSPFTRPNGTLADVFVGYRGTQGVVVEAPFLGTFLSPTATLELGTGGVPEVRGRFAALNLIVRPNTNLVCVSSFAPTL
jgi:hypothetical protein